LRRRVIVWKIFRQKVRREGRRKRSAAARGSEKLLFLPFGITD
jgi:hypothetical protein